MPKYQLLSTRRVAGKVVQASPDKPQEVTLKSDEFVITAPRFIDGRYIPASPDLPQTIRLAEGEKLDAGLVPLEDSRDVAPLKPHFAAKEGAGTSAAAVFSAQVPGDMRAISPLIAPSGPVMARTIEEVVEATGVPLNARKGADPVEQPRAQAPLPGESTQKAHDTKGAKRASDKDV